MPRTPINLLASIALVWLVAARSVAGDAAPEQLGTVHFENSCAPAVQVEFDRSVALLHSFSFRDALEGFTRVLERDPSCAIAHWGVALCHWGNPFAGLKVGPPLERGLAAVRTGLSTGSPSARERAYIAAAAELFTDATTVSHPERTRRYERALEGLQREFPDDPEARIFYAVALTQTAPPTDKTYANQLKAASILEPMFERIPDHPGLAHYIIHAYDVPALAPRALGAARRYARIAPSAPHALHMPSHTFTRVGDWKSSIDANRASAEAALKDGAPAEALHALDYQVYAYLQIARDREARAVLERIPAVTRQLDVAAIGGAAPGSAGVFARSAIPARYVLERGAWREAAALEPTPSPFPQADAVTHYARALGAARRGRPAAAGPDLERLEALRDALAGRNDAYWAEQVDLQRRIASAWVRFAGGRRAEALGALRAAADAEDATDKSAVTPGPLAPARELLGEMLLEAGQPRQALEAFEATIHKEPNRFRGIYGAARAAEAAGEPARAARYYGRLLELTREADTERAELKRARMYVERHKIAAREP